MKYCETCRATYPADFTTCPKDQTVLRITTEWTQGMVIRDKYEVLEKIGAGGMATVYRVRHLAFNEERAIKVVGSRLTDDPSFLKRFKTEAIVTRKLQHPNAVRVDDLETTDDGRPYIVMEYVKGRNLREVIQKDGPLPLNRALNIVWQAASALAGAHQMGITHRDIKPDNILLVPQPGGELVKVLDFGIAKVREGALDLGGGYTATQTGMVVGTPQYISPEQALGRHGDQIDGRADLYSLGVVLYEMLTGELPFQSDTPMGLLMHHIQTRPTPPHQLKPELGIPAGISMVLMRALEKQPEKRFQSAAEMLEALSQARPSVAQRAAATTRAMPAEAMAEAAAGLPRVAAAAETAPQMGAATPVPAAKPTMLPTPQAERPVRRATPPPEPGKRRWTGPFLLALIAIVLVVFIASRKQQSSGAASFNTDPLDKPTLRVSNYTDYPGCFNCWAESISDVDSGDIISFDVYYHNTGPDTADDAKVRISFMKRQGGSQILATAQVWAKNASSAEGTARVTLRSGLSISRLDFVDAAWHPNQSTSASALPDGFAITSAGASIGDIAPGWSTQGHLSARFRLITTNNQLPTAPPAFPSIPIADEPEGSAPASTPQAPETARQTTTGSETASEPAEPTPAAAETEPALPAGAPQRRKPAETIAKLLHYGKQQAEAGNYRQAIRAFQAVLAIDPDNAYAQEGIRRVKEAMQTREPGQGTRRR